MMNRPLTAARAWSQALLLAALPTALIGCGDTVAPVPASTTTAGTTSTSTPPADPGTTGPGTTAPAAPAAPVANQVSDFTLVDVNPNSASHKAAISPRQQLGQISVWYFGHAT